MGRDPASYHASIGVNAIEAEAPKIVKEPIFRNISTLLSPVFGLSAKLQADRDLRELHKIMGETNTIIMYSQDTCAPCKDTKRILGNDDSVRAVLQEYDAQICVVDIARSRSEAIEIVMENPHVSAVPFFRAYGKDASRKWQPWRGSFVNKGLFMKAMHYWYGDADVHFAAEKSLNDSGIYFNPYLNPKGVRISKPKPATPLAAVTPLSSATPPEQLDPMFTAIEDIVGEPTKDIEWKDQLDLDVKKLQGRMNDRNMVLWYSTKWCGPCKMAKKDYASNPLVKETVNKYGLDIVILDVTGDVNMRNIQIAQHLGNQVFGVPAFVTYEKPGNRVDKPITGYMPSNNFVDILVSRYDKTDLGEEAKARLFKAGVWPRQPAGKPARKPVPTVDPKELEQEIVAASGKKRTRRTRRKLIGK
jgi:thioredoxin-related protein